MKISFLFRGEQVPGREANARQQDSVVCEQENRCRFLNIVSRGETPRAAKRGLDTVFCPTPNDHDGDAVPTGAGDHG
jgi:hypothetical protein